MKFAASYSGGKESALSVYRAIKQGHEPIALITTFNTDAGRSHFHGLSEKMLENVSKALDIPLWLIETSGKEYVHNFEKALLRAKEAGAEACVFGDIDIEGHLKWCSERCENVGIKPLFPLWGEARSDIVNEVIDSGFVANISIIDTKYLSDNFLGLKLTKEVAEQIAAGGADICGENGEYHTFVSDGPIFKYPVGFYFGEKTVKDTYAIANVFSIHDCYSI
ncbi:MAG: diphthine--ammonia ligase [Defluviitaleaceae bacterium]|nr:diphthine--ammonia ligase [Defluviitaleaceae bacterium]